MSMMPHYVDCGTLSTIQGSFAGTNPGGDGANGSAHYAFQVPSDFSCLEALEIMIVGAQGSTVARMCFNSTYPAEGAIAGSQTGNIAGANYAIVTAAIQYIDISAVLGSLAAGDNVDIAARREGGSGCDTVTDLIAGAIRMEYS